jgi:hypothetical protein
LSAVRIAKKKAGFDKFQRFRPLSPPQILKLCLNMGEREKSEKAEWDNDQRQVLIAEIKNEMARGITSESGFKKQSWQRILHNFNETTRLFYNKDQIQSQWSELKKKYVIFLKLKENSGFGWDSTAKIPTAPESVWDAYITAHPKSKEFL